MSGEFATALQQTNEIELTVTGRVSGRQISLPVWFVSEDGKFYLLPVHGSDTDWYKNVLKTPRLRLTASGESVTGTATPITDPGSVRDVVDRFRASYGSDQVAQYYPKTDVAVDVDLPRSAS
ncbi:MAG TPA: nitroreductase/quinone reductase family protein [Streptosporangiaceae bacterium]|nr:nitroreductase/quinone reductase family protein [Streptosporangiaceae bacterium]